MTLIAVLGLLLVGCTVKPPVAPRVQEAANFTYRLESPGQVSVAVYDAEGRLLRSLLHGARLEAGEHALAWDGLDRDGQAVAPGEYTVRLLQTPGFTAEFVTALGINPGIARTDPAYQRGGSQWVGSHGGVTALAADETGLYLGARLAEFVPVVLKQSFDGRRRFWERPQYQAAQGALCMARAGTRLLFLQANGRAILVNPATGAPTGEWDLKHEAVPRDPTKYYKTGEKVYDVTTIDLAARDQTIVVSHRRQNVVRWLDDKGATAAEVSVPAPRGITVAPDGRVLVISGTSVLTIQRDGTTHTNATGLSAPLRLTVDPSSDELLVVEAAPSHQIKRFAPTGELRQTYGRLGGRQHGPYVPTDFYGVTSIVADGTGGFFIAEPDGAPRRVAHVNRAGEIVNEWYGPCGFFSAMAVDPRDPTQVWYMPTGGGELVLAKIDYRTGQWAVRETHRVTGDLFPANLGYRNRPSIQYHNDRRYLVFATVPPSVAEHRDGRLIPVAAGGHEGPALEKARALTGDGAKAAGFQWADENGDGQPQASEIRFLTRKLPIGFKFPVSVGREFTYWLGGSKSGSGVVSRLAPTAFGAAGPIYSTRWQTVGTLPLPARSAFRSYGVLDTTTGVYVAFACARDPQGDSFPTDRVGKVRLVKFNAAGQAEWSVGRHASRNSHDLAQPSPPGDFHEPTGFAGLVRDTVIACDRSVRPATAWTTDGLYAGDFLDHRADDGLPNTFYRWWRTREGPDAILNFDQETFGQVVEHEGAMYWFANGWQCIPVYRMTGWDGWRRQEWQVRVATPPVTAAAKGTGLLGRYYENPDFADLPARQRRDARIWFAPQQWYGMVTEVWNTNVAGMQRARNFSVRWEGEIEAPLSEDFVFSVTATGRVQLWLDGQSVLKNQSEKRRTWTAPPRPMQAGQRCAVRLDYSVRGETPECSLNWESFTLDRERIPTAYLYPPTKP